MHLAMLLGAFASLIVGGVTRTYVLHVPPHAPKSPALIVAFHGHLGSGANMEKLSGFDAPSDRKGFIVAYPDGLQRGWNDGRTGGSNTADDLGFATALVATLERQYGVDPERVYFTGFSNGATFSQYAACKMSTTVAAIAAVSGSMPVDDRPGCSPQRAISVLEIAGTDDPIMPYAGGEIELLGMARGAVLSFDATTQYWAQNAGCEAKPQVTALAPIAPADGTSVQRAAYQGCRDGSAVVAYTVKGAGHTWPGGEQYLPRALIGISSTQLDATQTIVDFLLSHVLSS